MCVLKQKCCFQIIAGDLDFDSSYKAMASSSVSQDDVENDYEKLEKRSRIRTARARQINPQVNKAFYLLYQIT